MRLILALACTGERAFPERFVEAWCATLEECDPEAFFFLFPDRRGCEDGLLPEQQAASEGCAFDPDAARACLEAVDEGRCADFLDGAWAADCERAWACDGAGG